MRRGVVNGTDAMETINAAATVIASGEIRDPPASLQKRRWGSYWSLCSCFGSHKNKRIGHAVLSPETRVTGQDAPTAERPSQAPSIALPFVAPPSSPASFIPSEPPSATQSPNGILSHTNVSASMYSPGGPSSIFAIGPYAHETQLVSPPVFSTFTTEPSTAPYTPPPESVHLTTPSSPEVPFARLLEDNRQYGEAGQRYPLSQYEFQSYYLQPGSPVSHLISPSSGISNSGTSSPFLDPEFASGHPFFLQFRNGNPPKLLDLEKIVIREWESRQESGAVTPDGAGPASCDNRFLERQHSDVAPLPDTRNGLRNDETVIDHRVSFEVTAEEVIRCVEKDPVVIPNAAPTSSGNVGRAGDGKPNDTANGNDYRAEETSMNAAKNVVIGGENDQRHQKSRTITLGSAKEFNFDNVDGGGSGEPRISSNWWANEKVVNEEVKPCKDWSFFPMVHTGVS